MDATYNPASSGSFSLHVHVSLFLTHMPQVQVKTTTSPQCTHSHQTTLRSLYPLLSLTMLWLREMKCWCYPFPLDCLLLSFHSILPVLVSQSETMMVMKIHVFTVQFPGSLCTLGGVLYLITTLLNSAYK